MKFADPPQKSRGGAALRMIAWGVINLDELPYKAQCEVKHKLRKELKPYKLRISHRNGKLDTHDVTGKPMKLYFSETTLWKKEHRLFEGTFQECAQEALRRIEIVT
jgi:hypothetical protein